MGEVWLAADDKLGGEVALKFLADQVRWDPAGLALLKDETNRSRLLSHPHIVRVHDFAEDAAHAAIAMEFLPGGSLHHRRAALTPPVLTVEEIMIWLPGVAAGIDYAHARKIIHRDLKPGNLLASADGMVKVADFGIAQTMLETSLRISQWQPAGTLAYMGPQQHFGESPRPADDIYALGATLYELLTGKPPFYSGNLAAQIERRVPDRIAVRRKELGLPDATLPDAWERAIAACLAKRAEDRPASAEEFVASLRPAARRASVRSPSQRARSFRRTFFFGVAALVALTAVWMFFRSAPTAGMPKFASDETRAYAAWNLDGDGQDASGRGLHLVVARGVPAPDRHGRIDRALAFNGNTGVQHPRFPTDGWRGDRPFAVAVWVRPRASANLGLKTPLAGVRTERQGDLFWLLGLNSGRPFLTLGRTQVDKPDEVFASEPLPAERWAHLAVSSDGRRLSLFVDGRQVAESRVERHGAAVFREEATLAVGGIHKTDAARLAGELDELRLWRRALSADEVARLATAEPPPRFTPTRGNYPDREDLPAAVQREFGSEARLADWNDLRRWHADDTRAFATEIGLAVGAPDIFLQRAGSRFSEAPRHYFVTRFDGTKPDYYGAHDELGSMTLALGSWPGATMRALVRLPPATVRRESLAVDSDGNVSYVLPEGAAARAVSADWRQELRRERGAGAQVLLRLRGGRELRAVCAPVADGLFALALGDAQRPELSRQIPASYGPLTFTVVAGPGRLVFRAVTSLGAEPLFQETVSLPDFQAGDIAVLSVSGVDAAEVAVER